MHLKLVTVVSALAVTALLSVPAFGQEAPQTEFREEMEVTEVLLDVLVTDTSGNVILGLQPDDFVVQDAGEARSVSSATFYSNRRFVDTELAADVLGPAQESIPVDRYFVLFFHDQRAEDTRLTSNHLDAVRWARKWVAEELLPNDWVAVLSYDVKLKIHQDFSNDPRALRRALDGVARGSDPGSNWPSRQPTGGGPSLTKNLPQGKDLRKQTTRIYSALEVSAEAAGHILGRKNFLLFSMGFGELVGFGTYQPDKRYYPPMMQALNDNNVAVYAISLIRNFAEETAAQSALNNILSSLASDTGGRYYFNFVNFREPLREVVADNGGYYLLSYQSETPAGKRGYRTVTVTTRNPDFKVRARQGYLYGD